MLLKTYGDLNKLLSSASDKKENNANYYENYVYRYTKMLSKIKSELENSKLTDFDIKMIDIPLLFNLLYLLIHLVSKQFSTNFGIIYITIYIFN